MARHIYCICGNEYFLPVYTPNDNITIKRCTRCKRYLVIVFYYKEGNKNG